MMTKIRHLILKLELVLPMEIGLSIRYNGCLVIFTGRLSGKVHFSFLKEHEDMEVVIQGRAPSDLAIPLVTPLKYAEPLDEFTARRIRAQIDRAVMEMVQDREITELKRLARESNSDQEVTLKVA